MFKIIGICGPSGSGKTTLAITLQERLEEVLILSLDAYYKTFNPVDGNFSKINYDCPESLDLELFNTHLCDLKKGKGINVPQYDYVTHKRLKDYLLLVPERYIVVDGLFLYNVGVSESVFDLKIYVDADRNTCLERRIRRDFKERGRTKESVVFQFENDVLPMFEKYVLPNKELADIVFDGREFNEKDLMNLLFEVQKGN